jgi:hypothetical protein
MYSFLYFFVSFFVGVCYILMLIESRNFLSRISLSISQKLATGLCPQPYESIPYFHVMFEILLNIVFPFVCMFQAVCSLLLFPQKLYMHFQSILCLLHVLPILSFSDDPNNI